MKDKRNNRIKFLSEKIVALEKEMRLGKNVQENQDKIENIMSTLSIEEMLQIDDYITKKKMLT
ncbi:MAG: hypothetical protein LIO71_02800 [Ruminococcus sp.]|nr:hypothetical protein [Ruminococcus sp.]